MKNEIIREGYLDIEGWHNHAKEILGTGGVSSCISTQSNNLLQKIFFRVNNNDNIMIAVIDPETKKAEYYGIRKLTERECFRLMGVREKNIDKILCPESTENRTSRTAQYRAAGNSIVVDPMKEIFRKLFIPSQKGNDSQQLTLF